MLAGSVEATRRGIMAVADQANACVSYFTTPLNTHKRLGPAGATPGGSSHGQGEPGGVQTGSGRLA